MPTKIAYLVDRYEGPQAGTEGQLLLLIEHLDRSRYEPSLTLLRTSEYIERNSFPCPVRVLGITKVASIQSVLRMLSFAMALRREHYHLVHCFFNDSSLIAPFFLKLFRIRVLVSRRDMGFWYTRKNLAVLRIVARFVDRYVANSEAVKRVVRRREWVLNRRMSVIYNGYAVAVRAADEAKPDTVFQKISACSPIVGIVANLRPIKRIDVLLQAFAIACGKDSAARLVIVGDVSSREGTSTLSELEHLGSRLGIADRLIFTGLVDTPMKYIERFTVAVLCSESEGFSNSLVEYMKARRPLVCTDTGGNAELVQDGRNGFLVPVGDIAALADRLARLLADTELARSLGQAAYETASSLTQARMVTEQMACYDDVLSKYTARARRSRRLGPPSSN